MELLKEIPDNFIHSVVTDPPYGISFMNKHWDYEIPKVEVWKEILRVLKPGAFILVACGTRTQHRMAVNIEDAGFEIRDVISWIYGSGFPKSLDISKAIDKQAGAEREVIGIKKHSANQQIETFKNSGDYILTAPSTEAAKQWEGFGTALKPATEFWTLARKPLSENTVAENVLKHGTGGLNIDGCRINPGEIIPGGGNGKASKGHSWNGNGTDEIIRERVESHSQGRFPANLILDEFAAAELDKQSGERKSGGANGVRTIKGTEHLKGLKPLTISNGMPPSEGGASRFFYCAKASKSERGKTNNHSTVKPMALMQYLIKLITPIDGIVLDPFAGSGSTLIAAALMGKGYKFLGFEMDGNHVKIINERLDAEFGLFKDNL